jgi:hypothetical protein
VLISHKHKFITIDIPKTGTGSLSETLRTMEGVVDVLGKPYDGSEDILKRHASISDVEQGFHENNWLSFNSYYKYSVVRNPWDRYFSFFKYYKMKADEHPESTAYRNDIERKQGEMASKLFRCKRPSRVLKLLIRKQPPHSYFLLNKNGECEFNKINLFENLKIGFEEFCYDIGIGLPDLKHANKSPESITKEEIYTQELIDMVAEKEKWVIDRFGYNYI